MSTLVAAASLRSGSLLLVDFPLPKRRFTALQHTQRYATQATKEMLRLLSAAMASDPSAKRDGVTVD